MRSLIELNELRDTIVEELKNMINNGKSEQRELNEEERASFDKKLGELKALDNEIREARENQESITKKFNQVTMEKKEFNLLKAVRNIANGNELSVEERAFVENGKIKLPTERRSAIVAGANGATVEVEVKDMFAALRDNSVLASAGARIYTGLKGNVKVPVLTGATASWEGETAAANDGAAAVTALNLSPKRLTCYVDISNQALIQDSASLQTAIENDLAMAVVEKLQKTVLGNGAGTLTQPAGICHGKEATTITDFKGIATLESKVEEKNVGAIAYIMSPKAKASIRSLTFPKTTSLVYAGGEVDGVPAYVSNSVAQGQYIVGDFSNVIIGVWDVEITVDTMSQQVNGAVRLVVNGYYDAQYAHTDAFEVGSLS